MYSKACLKSYGISYNFLIAVFGLLCFGFGIYLNIAVATQEEPEDRIYFNLQNVGILGFHQGNAIFILFLGIILFVLFSVGVYASWKEHVFLIKQYNIFIVLLLLIELIVLICIAVKIRDGGSIRESYFTTFDVAIAEYSKNVTIRKAIDEYQISHFCCGSRNSFDYKKDNQSLPLSCCLAEIPSCTYGTNFVYEYGCGYKIFANERNAAGWLLLGLVDAEVFGLVGGYLLYRKLKSGEY